MWPKLIFSNSVQLSLKKAPLPEILPSGISLFLQLLSWCAQLHVILDHVVEAMVSSQHEMHSCTFDQGAEAWLREVFVPENT